MSSIKETLALFDATIQIDLYDNMAAARWQQYYNPPAPARPDFNVKYISLSLSLYFLDNFSSPG